MWRGLREVDAVVDCHVDGQAFYDSGMLTRLGLVLINIWLVTGSPRQSEGRAPYSGHQAARQAKAGSKAGQGRQARARQAKAGSARRNARQAARRQGGVRPPQREASRQGQAAPQPFRREPRPLA